MIFRDASVLGVLDSFFHEINQELELSCIDLNRDHFG